ncbi:MAG: glutamate--tRNA ligase [Candidatus Aminicenantes bacterium]
MVRVRFAPSPTGHLHLGAARTSLFNWLFARHHKGKFILRIEDTDVDRSSGEMSRGIMEGLNWLGLDWDEGPFYQSTRIEIYRKKALQLVEKGMAYCCYCLPEEIQQRKKQAPCGGKDWKYDRRCLALSKEQRGRFEEEGRPRAIRFLVPEGRIQYQDLIHGLISVENETMEDFVLLRSDGLPTYHLSVVVDDLAQEITHIIRGDDHISNTPKQILLYQAFQGAVPRFAHLALILGSDRKKLSKRHAVTSVLQYREMGYLPLAMLNFLAQMSWSPGEEEGIYTMKEMVEKFSLEKVSKGHPVLDLAKLEWMNGQLISHMESSELAPLVADALKRENLWQDELLKEKKEWFFRLIHLLKQRARRVKDIAVKARPYLCDDFSYDQTGVEKYLKDHRLEVLLPKLKKDFLDMDDFSAPSIEKVLRQRAEKEGVKASLFIHALRMLVVGEPVSPGIFEVLELVGKEKATDRMEKLHEAQGVSP